MERYLPRLGKRRLLYACILVFCVVSSAANETKLPIVALNQDFTQMPASFAKDEENAAGVRKYFNSVCKGGLTHFLINPNGHNTAYASKVWDSVWHHDDRLIDQPLKQFDNLRVLHENGIDWVQVMIDACREQGVSPWMLSIHSAKSSCGVWFPLSAIRDGQNFIRFGQLDGSNIRLLTCELFLRAGKTKGEI